MNSRTNQILLAAMLLAAILGWLGGYYLSDYVSYIKFLGILFLNALRIIIVPLVAISIITAITTVGEIKRSGKAIGPNLIFFFLSTGVAVLIGLVLTNIIAPGFAGAEQNEMGSQGVGRVWSDFVTTLIPSNLFQVSSWGFGSGLLFLSVIIGIALTSLGNAARSLTDLISVIDRVLQKFLTYIIYFAPIGVLALVSNLAADYHDTFTVLGTRLGLYAVIVLAGLVIQAAAILPLALKGYTGKGPLRFMLNRGDTLSAAFFTGTTETGKAIPAIRPVEERLAFLHRSGTALYLGVASVFIAQSFGIALSPTQQIIIFITSIFASIISTNVPFAGIVSLAFVLSSIGLPVEGVTLILAAEWLLERCRKVVDVWTHQVAHGILTESPEIKPVRKPLPVPVASGPVDSHAPKAYEPKRTRPERIDKPDRMSRGGRYELRGRSGKPGEFQKRDRRNDRGDRIDRGKPPSRERRPEPPRDTIPAKENIIPKENVEKELERLRKQLSLTPESPKPVVEPTPERPAAKKDEFFEAGIPKFEFFPEIPKPPAVEETSPPPAETKSEPEPEIPEEKPEFAEKPSEEPPSAEEEKKSEAEEDAWGRSPKRHPNK